jgi:hypothetical protein
VGNQLPASRTRTVVVDRRTVTEGDVGEQGAVPEYVSLYRPASGLPRQAVVWLAQDGAKDDVRAAHCPSTAKLSGYREAVYQDRYLRSRVVSAPQDQLVHVDS